MKLDCSLCRVYDKGMTVRTGKARQRLQQPFPPFGREEGSSGIVERGDAPGFIQHHHRLGHGGGESRPKGVGVRDVAVYLTDQVG